MWNPASLPNPGVRADLRAMPNTRSLSPTILQDDSAPRIPGIGELFEFFWSLAPAALTLVVTIFVKYDFPVAWPQMNQWLIKSMEGLYNNMQSL